MSLTIISNLRHAARNRETVVIGGGEFNAKELSQAANVLEQHGQLLEALKDAHPLIVNDELRMRIGNLIAKAACIL
jgi:hypothetical protein